MKRLLLAAMAVLGSCFVAKANNVQLSNVSLNGQNTAGHFSMVNFNISWDNSWRTSTNESNYDGAWLFVKFRKQGTSLWKHATLNYVSPGTAVASGHNEPSGATIKQPADGKGVFVYRNGDGQGTVAFDGASLRWNYGVDGVNDNDSVEINVFAMEVVYIPGGAFNLGSGGTEYDHFCVYGTSAPTANPYYVNSNNAITVGTASGNLYYVSTIPTYPTFYPGGGDQVGPIPAAYPKGFNGFWIMKYEASQKQYADFINNLDLAKANARNFLTSATGVHPDIMPQYAERACGGAGWADLVAYADWSGLRPISEFEYEKACRGDSISPIANEYAWGNTTLTNINGITYSGLENEAALGNCNISGTPRRCGIFATSTSDRVSSGGTYFGVMDMSGSLFELTGSIGASAGRALNASVHGDGNLSANGDTDLPVWSDLTLSLRGGIGVDLARVSDRMYGSSSAARAPGYGIRLGRTAE